MIFGIYLSDFLQEESDSGIMAIHARKLSPLLAGMVMIPLQLSS
jgi:hypothetical protein